MSFTPYLSALTKRGSRSIPEPGDLPSVSTIGAVSRDKVDALAAFVGTDVGVAPILIHNEIFPLILDLLTSNAIPVRVPGIVHVSQSWRLLAPLPADAHVMLTAKVVDFTVSDGDATITIVGIVEQGGGLLYVEEARYLAKKTRLPDAHVSAELVGESGVIDVDQLPDVPRLRETYGVNDRGRLDVGQANGLASRDFGAASGRAWAKLSGDVNPIHLSRATSIPFGYRRPILHGGAVEAWAEVQAGITGDTPASAALLFRAPLSLPNLVEAVELADGDIAILEARSGRDLVHLRASTHQVREISTEIVFPRVGGRRSSTAVSQGMFEAAASGDPAVAQAVAGVRNWRKEYRDAVVAVTALDDPVNGPDAARRGLAFLDELVTADGRGLGSLRPRVSDVREHEIITGSGEIPRFSVPFEGRELSGSELLDQVAQWAGNNLMTSAAASRIAQIVADPGMLDLRGRRIAVIGAGAELAPTRFLLSRGADVLGVIRPESSRLTGLRTQAGQWAGRLHVSPVGDVVEQPEDVAGWLAMSDPEAMIETLYAPGAKNLLATIGADVVTRLVGAETDVLMGWLGSPMDAYVLPEDLQPGGSDWLIHPPQEKKSLFGRKDSKRHPGMVGDVFNGLLTMQGPSYAAAKRIGRWRATVRRAEGGRVCYHVAPMAQTNSVLAVAQLRAAYRGMQKMGISPLPARTTSVLMGALFAADLAAPRTLGDDFLVREAFPTGMWGANADPESILVKAVLLGSGAYLRR